MVAIPVPVFVAVTVTPGITAPVESETVQPTVALLDWANACGADTNSTSSRLATRESLLMDPPYLWLWASAQGHSEQNMCRRNRRAPKAVAVQVLLNRDRA